MPPPPPDLDLKIRRLHPASVADFTHIRLSALRTSPSAFGSSYAAEARMTTAEQAERLAGAYTFGAYAGDAIIGVAGFRPSLREKDAHCAPVHGFFVEPAWRGRGVGRALMEEVLVAARGLGTVEMLIVAVVVDNVAAVRLYEGLGFRRYGVLPRALKGEDRYWDVAEMVLFLNTDGIGNGDVVGGSDG